MLGAYTCSTYRTHTEVITVSVVYFHDIISGHIMCELGSDTALYKFGDIYVKTYFSAYARGHTARGNYGTSNVLRDAHSASRLLDF